MRAELERLLIAGRFSGYDGLAEWLQGQGFAISRSSLHRWGSTFEERCAGLKLATEQARAIVEASPDSEGAMGMALTRLVQEKLFGVLLDLQVDPSDVPLPKLTRAIADLSRAGVTQLKHAADVRKQARAELLAEQADQLKKIERDGGLGAAAIDTFRRQILGMPA